jgi:hypothetical protein
MQIHALYTGTDNATANMRLSKRAKNNPLRETRFEVSVTNLRKIADEIGDAVNYMVDLWYLKTNADGFAMQTSLPTKPARADRLTIHSLKPSQILQSANAGLDHS